MKPYELTIATLLLLAFSLPGMAQKRIINRETRPQAPKTESIKIERINVLRVFKSMKPGVYFRNKMRTSISVFDEELRI